MKKRIIYILVGLLCLGALAGFAQPKKETIQEQVLRLQIENEALKKENAYLRQRLNQTQSQLNKQDIYPYYLTQEIQNTCEKYPKCRNTIAQSYKQNPSYQVISLRSEEQGVTSFPGFPKKHTSKTVLEGTCRAKGVMACFFRLVVAYDGEPIS